MIKSYGDDDDDCEFPLPSQETYDKIMQETTESIERIVKVKISAAQPSAPVPQVDSTQFIRYTPSEQGLKFDDMPKQRIIRMAAMPVDPLEPPKFKFRKDIRAPIAASAPVMHSPTRNLSSEEQQNWVIPPCISNWKNSKGHVIPLDKREAADGRKLRELAINDNFARVADSLYLAERIAREEIEKRQAVQGRVKQVQQQEKEKQLRELASQSRKERGGLIGIGGSGLELEEEKNIKLEQNEKMSNEEERDMLKGERKRKEEKEKSEKHKYKRKHSDISDETSSEEEHGHSKRKTLEKEREDKGEKRFRDDRDEAEKEKEKEAYRLMQKKQREREYAKSNKKRRRHGEEDSDDSDDDKNNRIVLNASGVPVSSSSSSSTSLRSTQLLYDQRLFNQSEGLGTGFGSDEDYNIFDQPFRPDSVTSSVGRMFRSQATKFKAGGFEEDEQREKRKKIGDDRDGIIDGSGIIGGAAKEFHAVEFD